MKFILKICLFALLLMIGKYTKSDEQTIKQESQPLQNELNAYTETRNLTDLTPNEIANKTRFTADL
ncbi:hypothetical protein [Pontibacter arcticus]|uniref:Uncharacterized protein n=1 Tax=Pontibacter arcticus TaxID=2080288 RepID=A0A364RAY1_9BACT|nr:hypothetical protein [Pontibacter arcticus]RAU81491.1 hypothetical protein DP923_15395 [Pontibacter arcticus]